MANIGELHEEFITASSKTRTDALGSSATI